nr:hypothetical protein [Tanacetum cinerariifolium]
MLNKKNYVPWSSRLLRYAKSRPNGKFIHNSVNGPYVKRMIPEPGDTNREVPVNETFHVQTDDELTGNELKQIEADDQAIQTILFGLPKDIYMISSNPRNRQIAQPGMNMGQDRQMQMVGARAEGNATGQNGNQIRCYNCRGVGHFARSCTVRPSRRDAAYLQTQLLIAQKEEAEIQLQAEEFDLMAAAADLDEIEEVNANCILMANLHSSTLSNLLFFFVFMDDEMISLSCGIKSQAGSENRPPMLNKENYVPWSSCLLRYAKIRPNGKLIHNSIKNGPYVRQICDPNRKVPVNETFHVQTDDELTEKELKQIEADDQAIQTILFGLPKDIYVVVD